MFNAMAQDARSFLPLKPLVFQVLLSLSAGERHGWSLVREIQQAGAGARVLPANFYRTLRGMLADGMSSSPTRARSGSSHPALDTELTSCRAR
jgi:DNA-binding PadR family transcriptional regulator